MTPEMITAAFDAESERLSEVAAETGDSAFARPSPCVPWTVAELTGRAPASAAENRLIESLGVQRLPLG